MEIKKAFVYAEGDPSVGIQPSCWVIEGPMFLTEEEEEREAVREGLREVFTEIAMENVGVRFEDEQDTTGSFWDDDDEEEDYEEDEDDGDFS